MVSSILDRDRVRKLLGEVIRTDVDLDAFCLDFFPDVQRRFAGGMTRVAKVNLLLEVECELGLIVDKLRERFPENLIWAQQPPRPPPGATIAWVVAGGIIAMTLGILLFHSLHRTPLATATEQIPNGRMPAALSLPPGPVVPPPPVHGRIAVEHEGDIRAGGSVNITTPDAQTETLVKIKGQIEAQGDVRIGVTANPKPPTIQTQPKAGP